MPVRTVGDDDVMVEQLRHLSKVTSNRRIVLGIIPRAADFGVPATNFVVFDRRMVLAETVAAELTITAPSEIALYEKTFAVLATRAVYSNKARALITTARWSGGVRVTAEVHPKFKTGLTKSPRRTSQRQSCQRRSQLTARETQ